MFGMFAAPAHLVKAAKAMAQGGNEFQLTVEGFGRSTSVEQGYHCIATRLPKYNTATLVVMAKDPRILIGNRSEQLGRYLRSNEITTPVLPEWQRQIEDSLDRSGALRQLNCVGVDAWYADFGSPELDEIVSGLLKRKKVRI